MEAQTALYHYSYALQAYEQAFYEQQEKDQREAVSVASPTQAISCDASTTSSSTPRHPRDDSSANSDDLEGIAASKLVQVIEKPSDRPKFITKKGPTAKQPPNTNTTAKPPLSAPKPSFNLKSEPYDSAFPSLGGSDSSTATLSWAKKPAVAPSRKLDVSAPLYTPGTTGAAFSSLAVKERREADTSLHIAVTADAGGADPREKLERLEKSVEVESAADQVTDDKAKVVPSVNDASKQPAVSNEGGRRGGGGWTKKDRRAGPHVSSRGNGRGLPSSDPSSRGAGHGRSNADEADSWRRVSAKGKAK